MDLSTLVTVVTADTSGLRTEMPKATKTVEDFAQKTNAALKDVQSKKGLLGFSESLHEGMNKLKGFNSLLEIGFGLRVGRMIFEQLHEGVVKFSEGFADAQANGESFFESMADGARHILGLKSSFEQMNEQLKAFEEVEKKLNSVKFSARERQFQNDTGGITPYAPSKDKQPLLDELKTLIEARNQWTLEVGKAMSPDGMDYVGFTPEQARAMWHNRLNFATKKQAEVEGQIEDKQSDIRSLNLRFKRMDELHRSIGTWMVDNDPHSKLMGAVQVGQKTLKDIFGPTVEALTLGGQMVEDAGARMFGHRLNWLTGQVVGHGPFDQKPPVLKPGIQGLTDIAKELQLAALKGPNPEVDEAKKQTELQKSLPAIQKALETMVRLAGQGGFSFG